MTTYSIIEPLNDGKWVATVERLSSLKLGGLVVKCPKCSKKGIAFPYWIPKATEKPIFVCHTRYHKLVSVCEMDREQRKLVREKVKLKKEDIRVLMKHFRPFLLFSGGQDSLSMLGYIKRVNGRRKTGLTALHVDTTAGIPEVERYVKRVCNKFDLDLEIVKPERDFFSLAKKWGIPSPKSRWCCKTLKIRPIRDYLKTVHEPKMVVDGIRAAESTARAKYLPLWFHPGFNCLSLSPIFYWSNEEVKDFICKNKLPTIRKNGLAGSAECFCGAYATREDFEILQDSHPDLFDKLLEVEKANNYGYTFIYENGVKTPLKKLKRKKSKNAKTRRK